ncbi:DUF1918 domain-containing protein [Streptacidiphilus sp. MAP5-3]|jgi:hypothetical protein|uniref:DUF1918 domain-containing protein n=1 Tax=unclassified Streptacidiphilus TaxID=2643834 RepID=UPI003516A4F8
MQAAKGDWLLMHGPAGSNDRIAKVKEVLSGGAAPLYRVEYEDGHEAVVVASPATYIRVRKPRVVTVAPKSCYL